MTGHVSGVDRDVPAGVLQQPRAGQAHDAAADDTDFFGRHANGFPHSESRTAPGEADPATAMAVVVDNRLLIKLLAFHDKTGRTVGPVAYNLPDHIVRRDSRCNPGSAGIGTPVSSTAADSNLAIAERGGQDACAGRSENFSSTKGFFLLHNSKA